MGELGIRMFRDVTLHLTPIPLTVTHLLAPSADWKQPFQSLYICQRSLQFSDKLLFFVESTSQPPQKLRDKSEKAQAYGRVPIGDQKVLH